jgi:hypothetical protein
MIKFILRRVAMSGTSNCQLPLLNDNKARTKICFIEIIRLERTGFQIKFKERTHTCMHSPAYEGRHFAIWYVEP